MLASYAGDDLVSERRTVLSESLHYGREIRDFELKPVPPSRLRQRAIRHRLAAPRSAAGRCHYETKIAPREHREGRRRMHDFLKAEFSAVEVDRRVDVIDYVADANGSHLLPTTILLWPRRRLIIRRIHLGRRQALAPLDLRLGRLVELKRPDIDVARSLVGVDRDAGFRDLAVDQLFSL